MTTPSSLQTDRGTHDGSLLVELVRSAHDGNRSEPFSTAVETFSRLHDADVEPHGDEWYRGRIPLTLPNTGQQFAFEVALDSCTGCKACVAACHSLNGLDDDESWRRVGSLFGTVSTARSTSMAATVVRAVPEQRTVTAACHHCADPACLTGCPVDAYDKDPITGAVIHLDDQCIGCSYCTLTCPYEVPQYNDRLGIVRKCDLCQGRLTAGEAPACVQGCPNGAIRITVVDTAGAITAVRSGLRVSLVPGCADSSISVPTTRYTTSLASLDGLIAEDDDAVVTAPAHDPLAVMLVLTQVGVGLVGADAVLRARDGVRGPITAAVGVAIALVGMAVSFAHLGRPTKAWRVVLGIGHSWLSREAVALAAFAGTAFVHVVVLAPVTGAVAFVVGVGTVATSAQVYAVTRRRWWTLPRLLARFGFTTVVAVVSGAAVSSESAVLGIAAGTLMVIGARTMRGPRHHDPNHSLRRTAALLRGPLKGRVVAHRTLGVVAGVVMATGALTGATMVKALGLILFVMGALIERTLLFRAVAPDRMPGLR